jgi:iron-sulfur cluster repair protein YtfE (RIC family)
VFQEFGSELESYIELEETALIPNLLAYIGGRLPTQDVWETVRLLRHGKDALVRLLPEMCQLTEGFLTPTESCQSYTELLVVLRAIETELVCECLLERDVLSLRRCLAPRA